ncbi:MAG: type II toxin-antitoxin system HigB family toxin [bacterium]
MRVISKSMLRAFGERHPDAELALRSWHEEAEAAVWPGPADVKRKYGSASVIRGNRMVFNICGNKYRLVVKFNYAWQVAYTRFVGTHAEYDSIKVEVV